MWIKLARLYRALYSIKNCTSHISESRMPRGFTKNRRRVEISVRNIGNIFVCFYCPTSTYNLGCEIIEQLRKYRINFEWDGSICRPITIKK